MALTITDADRAEADWRLQQCEIETSISGARVLNREEVRNTLIQLVAERAQARAACVPFALVADATDDHPDDETFWTIVTGSGKTRMTRAMVVAAREACR